MPRGLRRGQIVKTVVAEFLERWRPLEPAARSARLHDASGRGRSPRSSRRRTGVAVGSGRSSRASSRTGSRAACGSNRIRPRSTASRNFDGNLTRAHLEDETNPWNTYRIAGLPPTPIANPGEASLRAVVEPAQTDYLFFVAQGDGAHVFAKSFDEHLANVNRYQRRQSSR
jgi:hypothetical protein